MKRKDSDDGKCMLMLDFIYASRSVYHVCLFRVVVGYYTKEFWFGKFVQELTRRQQGYRVSIKHYSHVIISYSKLIKNSECSK